MLFYQEVIIPKLYENTVATAKSDISDACSLEITTGAWTSRSIQIYISYTAHFLTPEFVSKTYCLNVESSNETHTAVNLAKSLSECISEWTTRKQREKTLKLVIITDNAANIQGSSEQVATMHVSKLFRSYITVSYQ